VSRKVSRGRPDEERLTADLIALARQYRRYRKIAGLLEQAGWIINDKRVEPSACLMEINAECEGLRPRPPASVAGLDPRSSRRTDLSCASSIAACERFNGFFDEPYPGRTAHDQR
jgi:hypothetical protein